VKKTEGQRERSINKKGNLKEGVEKKGTVARKKHGKVCVTA
jgi:hypothetical protein